MGTPYEGRLAAGAQGVEEDIDSEGVCRVPHACCTHVLKHLLSFLGSIQPAIAQVFTLELVATYNLADLATRLLASHERGGPVQRRAMSSRLPHDLSMSAQSEMHIEDLRIPQRLSS